jgi:peptidoglycan/LPS O-acetylase OafA/YrhL
MFGTYRTLLAVMVIFLHLGGMPVIGGYAVFGFYILSGYLMTLIMHKNYGYSRVGLARYAANRFLRIYPIYWLSCLVSLLLIHFLGEGYVRNYHSSIYYPDDPIAIIRNLVLFFPSLNEPRLTPPAWALTVEIFFYICIGLGLSRSRKITAAWFILSIVYALLVNIMELGWNYKYFFIPAASLPFSTGAMVFHYREELAALFNRYLGGSYVPSILFSLVLVNWAAGFHMDSLRGFSFYINYILCAMILVALLERRSLPLISRRMDKVLGDFSYPVYLIHYQVGLVLLVLLQWAGYDIRQPTTGFALISLPFIFLAAWLMTRYIELPIELLRKRIKADSDGDRQVIVSVVQENPRLRQ